MRSPGVRTPPSAPDARFQSEGGGQSAGGVAASSPRSVIDQIERCSLSLHPVDLTAAANQGRRTTVPRRSCGFVLQEIGESQLLGSSEQVYFENRGLFHL